MKRSCMSLLQSQQTTIYLVYQIIIIIIEFVQLDEDLSHQMSSSRSRLSANCLLGAVWFDWLTPAPVPCPMSHLLAAAISAIHLEWAWTSSLRVERGAKADVVSWHGANE